jgi:O-antigen/teichoic acid export membrane protein
MALERDRRIVNAAAAGVIQRLVQAAGTLAVMPLVLTALRPAQFGVWGAMISLAWLSGLVDFGVGTALVTLVAHAIALGRPDEARSHVMGALAMGSGLAVLLLAAGSAMVLLAVPQAEAGPYLIAVVGLALNVPLSAANNVWMALQKGYVSGLWELVQTLLTVGGLVGATALTTDVRVYVAVVYCGLLLANLGSLAHLFLRHAELRPRGLAMSIVAVRTVAGKGMMYFLLALTGSLSFLLDNVLTLELLGPEASARMAVALRICVSAAGILWAVSQPLWPAFAEAAAKADRRWIRKRLLRGSALMVGGAVAGAAVLVAVGEPLLRWWLRGDLGIGRGMLWAMAAWIVAQALCRVPALLLNALSVTRFQVAVYSAATVIAFGLKFALAPRLGEAGILWGTAVALTVIAAPALLWRIGVWERSHTEAKTPGAITAPSTRADF